MVISSVQSSSTKVLALSAPGVVKAEASWGQGCPRRVHQPERVVPELWSLGHGEAPYQLIDEPPDSWHLDQGKTPLVNCS